MPSKNRHRVTFLVAVLVLITALGLTLASKSTAAAGPQLPTESCTAANEGDLAYTLTGARCQNGWKQWDAFQCTDLGEGQFAWVFIERSCDPSFTPAF